MAGYRVDVSRLTGRNKRIQQRSRARPERCYSTPPASGGVCATSAITNEQRSNRGRHRNAKALRTAPGRTEVAHRRPSSRRPYSAPTRLSRCHGHQVRCERRGQLVEHRRRRRPLPRSTKRRHHVRSTRPCSPVVSLVSRFPHLTPGSHRAERGPRRHRKVRHLCATLTTPSSCDDGGCIPNKANAATAVAHRKSAQNNDPGRSKNQRRHIYASALVRISTSASRVYHPPTPGGSWNWSVRDSSVVERLSNVSRCIGRGLLACTRDSLHAQPRRPPRPWSRSHWGVVMPSSRRGSAANVTHGAGVISIDARMMRCAH